MSGTLHVHRRSRAFFTGFMLLCTGLALFFLGYITQSEEMQKERGMVPAFSVLAAFCVLATICGVIDAWRHWVETDSQGIVVQGIFRLKERRWEDVQSAVWLMGSIVLECPSAKLELAFKNYAREDSQALVAAIRSALPPSVLRDERPALDRCRVVGAEQTVLTGDELAAAELSKSSVVFNSESFVPSRVIERPVLYAIGVWLVVSGVLSVWLLPIIFWSGIGALFLPVAVGTLQSLTLLLNLTSATKRLDILPDRISQQLTWSERVMRWNEIRKVLWNTREGAAIDLFGDVQRLTIRLNRFEPQRRLTLIRLLRDGLPRSLQANWSLFCHKTALPLRLELSSESPRPVAPGPDEVVETRWHIDRWALLIAVGVLGLVGCLHFSYQILAVRPKVVLGAIWLTILPLEAALIALRFSIPAEGKIHKASRWTSRERQALVWLFGGVVLFLASPFLGLASPFLGVASAFLGIAAICVCLALAITANSRRHRREDHEQKAEELMSAAEESARRWNQLDAQAAPLEPGISQP
jgi:hypothetical protein